MKYVFLTASLLSFFVILPTATLALDIGSTGTISTG